MPIVVILQPDDKLCDALAVHFHKAGYGIATTDNANEAIAIIKDRSPDVLITEIDLPGDATGWDLLETIRVTPDLKHTLVFFLTDRAGKEDKIRSLQMGVDDYLIKPLDFDELELRIANALKRQSR